jgi:hypothetical protein
MGECWWETANNLAPTFTCEIEQRIVKCELKARVMDDLNNEVLGRLMTLRDVHNVLPPISRHVCAKLELNTPVISQEFDNLTIRIKELEEECTSVTSEIAQLRIRLQSSSISGQEREDINEKIRELRENLHDQQTILYTRNYRRDQVKERVRTFENRRLKKILKYMCDYIYYNFGITHDKYTVCNTNRHLSVLSLRQLHDATEVYVNLHKKINNYERNDVNIVERFFEVERMDDGIEVVDNDIDIPEFVNA